MMKKHNLVNTRQRKRKQIPKLVSDVLKEKYTTKGYCEQNPLILSLCLVATGLICIVFWSYSYLNVDDLSSIEFDQCNNSLRESDKKKNNLEQPMFISEYLRIKMEITLKLIKHQREMEAFHQKRKYPETLYEELKRILEMISSIRSHIRIYENMPRISGGPSNFISDTTEKLREIEFTKLPDLDEQLDHHIFELETTIAELEQSKDDLMNKSFCLDQQILFHPLIEKLVGFHGLVINANGSDNNNTTPESNYSKDLDFDKILELHYHLAELYEQLELMSSKSNIDAFIGKIERILSMHEMEFLTEITSVHNENILLNKTVNFLSGNSYYLPDILIQKTIKQNSKEFHSLGQIQSYLLTKMEKTLEEIKSYNEEDNEPYWKIREMIEEDIENLYLRLEKLRFGTKNIRLGIYRNDEQFII